jgi:anaerobic sulfite reductase subunit C
MSYDINRKVVAKNAFRVTKVRNNTALRVRVPGGKITGDLMIKVAEIANKYGNGRIHMTTRQGFEVLGIPWDKMDEVNNDIQSVIEQLEINQPNGKGNGYPAAGTRNIASCIGNEVCPKAMYDTTEFAKEIEKVVFPHDFHFKIALTGCPNDGQKVRMHDFGIFGQAVVQLNQERCISCGKCKKKCTKLSTGAINMVNKTPLHNFEKCIGCGECVLICPTQAWTRSKEKYYRLAIMGRTGKKNPRLAQDWILWTNKEAIIKIIENTYSYVKEYIDTKLPKEHIGYIVDRTGMHEYAKWALNGVDLGDKAKVRKVVYWDGIKYKAGANII